MLEAPGYLSFPTRQSFSVLNNNLALILDEICYLKDVASPGAPIIQVPLSTEDTLGFHHVAWFNKNSLLLADISKKIIELYNVETKKWQSFPISSEYKLENLTVISPLSDKSFLIGFRCGSILRTDIIKKTTSVVSTYGLKNELGRVCSITLAEGSSGRVAVSYGKGHIAIHQSKNWELDPEHILFNTPSPKRALKWFPGSSTQLLAGGVHDGCFYVYDISKENPLLSRHEVEKQISSITFVNNSNLEFAATFFGPTKSHIEVFSYTPETKQIHKLKTLKCGEDAGLPIMDSAFCESSNLLVTGKVDTTHADPVIHMWDLSKAETKTITKEVAKSPFDPVFR